MSEPQFVSLRSRPNGVRIDTMRTKAGEMCFVVRKHGFIIFSHTLKGRYSKRLVLAVTKAQEEAADAATKWVHDEVDGDAIEAWKKLEFK
jgi:hypothetical protein